jgi:hypothetical protein
MILTSMPRHAYCGNRDATARLASRNHRPSTKSLFKALVDEPNPAQVLKKMSLALKSMGFRKMFMAMTVASSTIIV